MLASEATLIKNALAVIKAATSSQNDLPLDSSGLLAAIARWSGDCDAGTSGLQEISTSQSFLNVPVVAVANLPLSPVLNQEAIATDATVTTDGSTVVGGGSNRVLVRFNGTNWLIV